MVLATLLPARGSGVHFFETLTTAAVAALFFLHGAKLSREAIIAGITHWRLHLLILASTFVMFPVLGWVLRPVLQPLVTPELYTGVMFLCVLPATVQSAIAFTSALEPALNRRTVCGCPGWLMTKVGRPVALVNST